MVAKSVPGRSIRGLVLGEHQVTFTCACRQWTVVTLVDKVDEEFARHVRKVRGIQPDLSPPDTALPQVRV